MINNAEQKFKQMRYQADQLDVSAMEQRLEHKLRSAWKGKYMEEKIIPQVEAKPEKKSTKFNWKIFGYAAGGLVLLILAVTTSAIVSNNSAIPEINYEKELAMVEKDSVRATSNTSSGYNTQSVTFDPADTTVELGSSSGNKIQAFGEKVGDLADAIALEEPTIDYYNYNYNYNNNTNKSYTYDDDTGQKQLFDESVSLGIEVKDNMLDTVDKLRTEVGNLNGTIVSISYYSTAGTIYIQLPQEQLSSFETYLEQIDVDGELEVNQYSVENVSQEVVSVDEKIDTQTDRIEDLKKQIEEEEDEEQKEVLQKRLETYEGLLERYQEEREDVLEKYNMVDVTLTITEYKSFWEGNYYQYDRSTFLGEVKYQSSKALYFLIKTSGKLVGVVIWLAVYSIILIPFWLILRGLYRKIKKAIKKKKLAKQQAQQNQTPPTQS